MVTYTSIITELDENTTIFIQNKLEKTTKKYIYILCDITLFGAIVLYLVIFDTHK